MKILTMTPMILLLMTLLMPCVRTQTIDDFLKIPRPELCLTNDLGYEFVILKPANIEAAIDYAKIECKDVYEFSYQWSEIGMGGMGRIFMYHDFYYVLKVMTKNFAEAFAHNDPINPFRNELDVNRYLRNFFEAEPKVFDFRHYILEFRDYSENEQPQNSLGNGSKMEAEKVHFNNQGDIVYIDLEYFPCEKPSIEISKDKLIFIAMEMLSESFESEDFIQVLTELTSVERIQLYADLFEHLAVLHEAGVMHCDVKPDNIIMLYRNSPFIPESVSGNLDTKFSMAIVKEQREINNKVVTFRRLLFKIIDYGISKARDLENKKDPICRYSNDFFSLNMLNYRGGYKHIDGVFVNQDIFSMGATIIKLENLLQKEKSRGLDLRESFYQLTKSNILEDFDKELGEEFLRIMKSILKLDSVWSIESFVKDPEKVSFNTFDIWKQFNKLAFRLNSPFALDEAQAEEKIGVIIKATKEVREKIPQPAFESEMKPELGPLQPSEANERLIV